MKREVLGGTVHWVLGTGGPDESLAPSSFALPC